MKRELGAMFQALPLGAPLYRWNRYFTYGTVPLYVFLILEKLEN